MLSYEAMVGVIILVLMISGLVIRSRKPQVPVWSIMAFTSVITAASGLVKLDEFESVVDLDVIFFLIGMFSIISLAESSG